MNDGSRSSSRLSKKNKAIPSSPSDQDASGKSSPNFAVFSRSPQVQSKQSQQRLGTIGDQSYVKDTLKGMLTTDDNLKKSIADAVSKAIINNLLTSEDILDQLVERLCGNDNFTATICNNIQDKVASEITKSTTHDIAIANDKIRHLESNITQLQKGLATADAKIEEAEQYSRRNCLLIHGIPERNNEVTNAIAIKTFDDLSTDEVKVQILPSDLDRTHRLGKKKTSLDESKLRPRPIIVKFCSYDKRRLVFKNKSELKGSGITITESLTVQRMDLLRSAKRHEKVEAAWSIDGRISCLLHDKSRVNINNKRDIDNL